MVLTGTPTQILIQEHEIILGVLDSLEMLLKKIEGGEPPSADTLGGAVEFFRGFADKVHHDKEESLLFPAMQSFGIPVEGGPIGMMLAEHDEGRSYVRGMAEGIELMTSDAAGAKDRILNNGWAFLQMLRLHIQKENQILFPMADKVIPPAAMDGVQDDFAKVTREQGEGTLERFTTLAESIASVARS